MLAWDSWAEAKGLTQKGLNAYVQVNTLKLLVGAAVDDDPPALASFGIFTATGVTATVDAQTGTLTLSVDGAANDKVPGGYLVEATSPASPGRRNLSSKFRVLTGSATIANLGGATATIGASGLGSLLGLAATVLFDPALQALFPADGSPAARLAVEVTGELACRLFWAADFFSKSNYFQKSGGLRLRLG